MWFDGWDVNSGEIAPMPQGGLSTQASTELSFVENPVILRPVFPNLRYIFVKGIFDRVFPLW